MRVTRTFSLPKELADYLDFQVKDGHYASLSEYLRELIRAQKKAQFIKDLKEAEDDFKNGRVIKANSMRDLL